MDNTTKQSLISKVWSKIPGVAQWGIVIVVPLMIGILGNYFGIWFIFSNVSNTYQVMMHLRDVECQYGTNGVNQEMTKLIK